MFSQELGYSSVGIDIDEELINIALTKKRRRNSNARFLLLDMRMCGETFPGESYDVVTCLGNTIPHLASDEEVLKFFSSVLSILKPGGIFASQLVNYDKVLNSDSYKFKTIENKDFVFNRSYDNRGKYIDFTGTFLNKQSGKLYKNVITLLPLQSLKIKEMLDKSGFKDVLFYGGYDNELFNENSSALIFKARKNK